MTQNRIFSRRVSLARQQPGATANMAQFREPARADIPDVVWPLTPGDVFHRQDSCQQRGRCCRASRGRPGWEGRQRPELPRQVYGEAGGAGTNRCGPGNARG